MKLFIAGTGTDVGKTWVAGTLAKALVEAGLTVAYYKPIETGIRGPQDPERDVEWVRRLNEGRVTAQGGVWFTPPVAPLVADTAREIDLSQLETTVKTLDQTHDVVLIEGAGGLMVPLTPTMRTIDWLPHLDCSVLLVALSSLGTINHTLLSLEALAHRQQPVMGIVLNHYPTNLHTASLAEQTVIDTMVPWVEQLYPNQTPPPLWTCPTTTDQTDSTWVSASLLSRVNRPMRSGI